MSREGWVAWSDTEGGYVSAVLGVSQFKHQMDDAIARERAEYPGVVHVLGLRTVRVTIHEDEQPSTSGENGK
jgi:hypothetical protein